MTEAPRRNPYVGPRAFQTGEALYGRDGDILNLYYLLLAERVVLLFSPSGAGKSSLIQAGLIPRLQEKFAFIALIRVNLEPPEGFMKTAGFNRFVFSTLSSLEESAAQDQRLPPEQLAGMSLAEYLTRRDPPRQPEDESGKPSFQALIFDQFEEILTTEPNDYEAKRAFFDQLGEALRDNSRWALFSAREDYAAAFEPYLRAIPTRFANRYRLDLLDAGMALEAIQKPALEMGVEFSDEAAHQLVDDLRRVQTQRADGTSEMELGRYVEPVQLQVVCYRLWNNLSGFENRISEKHIAFVGSVDESLSAYYSEQVAAGAERFKVAERIIREWFNRQLITQQGLRGQVMLEPERSGGLDNPLIRFMESAHLVRAEKRAGSTWFELAHDRLIEPIRADNQKWLAAHLSLLQQQADLWNRQERPDSLLLREKDLAQARLWAREHESELLPYEREFLAACREEERRALRLKRRNRVITILGAAAMVLAAIAFLAYRQADVQRQAAQRQARVAQAGQLAAQANTALEQFPQRSLLLALEALKVTSSVGEARQAAAEEALREGLAQPRGLPLGNTRKAVTVVAFSQATLAGKSERWLASGGEDGSIELWDLQAPGPDSKPIRLDARGISIRVMAFSPGGGWLAAGGDQKDVLLWKLDGSNAAPFVLSGHQADIKSLAFSPDGRWLATGSVDETIRLWDLQSADPAKNSRTLTGHQGDVSALAFDPSGEWLASGSLDATVRLWKVNDPGAASIVLKGHQRNVTALAFSPEGRWLASGSYDHTVRLWDLQAADPAAKPVVLTGHSDIITSLAFSPRGRWLASGSEDHTARLWKLDAADPAADPLILRGHEDAVNVLAFSPEGRWLATGSSDHAVRLWDLQAPDPAATPGILLGHDGAVLTLAFSPEESSGAGSRWLASGGADGSTRLWDLSAPSPAESTDILRGHSDTVNLLAFSPGGNRLAAGSPDGSTLLWDMPGGGLPANPLTLRKSDAPILALSFSPTGRWLATGGGDGAVWLWDLKAANPAAGPGELRGNQNPVTTLAFSPTSSSGAGERWLASGSQDGSVRLWDLQSNPAGAEPLLLGADADHPVTGLAFSADTLAGTSTRWLAATSGFTLWLWDMQHPDAPPLALKKHADRVTTLAFSQDGKWLATGSMDKTAQLWKMGPNGPAAEPILLAGHEDWVNVLAFSPGGHWLATGSKDHTIRLWDLKAADPSAHATVLRGQDGSIGALAFSPGGDWLASGSDDHTTRLWNLRAADPATDAVVLRGQDGTIDAAAFSPTFSAGANAGRQWLATGSSDGSVRLWPLQLDDLKSQACQSAGRNLTLKEWAEFFANQAYDVTCVQWPAAQ